MKHKLITYTGAILMLFSATISALNTYPFRVHTVKATTLNEQIFLNQVSKQAQKTAKKYGVYPSVMIAQAILESNWGQSSLAIQSDNLFGIKGNADLNNPVNIFSTREEDNTGKSYSTKAAFRKYSSYKTSFDDNGKVLRLGTSWQPLRYEGTWIENATTPADATRALTGTYATDHHYNTSLDNVIAKYDLTKYDPTISNIVQTYKVNKNAATYEWPTNHAISAKNGNVTNGESVTIDKTITYYDGTKRMHIVNGGWVNSTVFEKIVLH